MSDESFVWYRAATLAERLAGRQELPPSAISNSAVLGGTDDARAQFSFAAWSTQRPFEDPALFGRRLSLEGLTEPLLRRLVAEPPADVCRRVGSDLEWVATIRNALSSAPTFEFHDLLTKSLKRIATIGFLDVAAPFISLGLRQLDSGAAALAGRRRACPFETEQVGRIFFADLAHAIMRIIGRTMVLELNVARLEGKLAGATSEDRFDSFVSQLHDLSRLREIFEEYPVLARLIAEQTSRWVAVSLELLDRLSQDFESLESAFAGRGSLGPLVEVSEGLADPRDGGRSVVIAKFGSGARVVYKPKSLAAEVHFQHVLRWLNAEGFAREFRTLTILDRGRYGWVEFVSPTECRTSDEVIGFYERTGAYLALLYAMDATDFHAGNIIASGEHPMLIDLEALFHPHRSTPDDRRPVSADRLADRSVRGSVLRIGLLPERLWGNSENEGLDISGLGGSPGQLTPHPVAAWEDPGTDTMRFVRKRRTVQAELNRPMLEGRPVDAIGHRDAVLRGFRSAYALLAARRDSLLAPGGPLAPFARDSVSAFIRSSRTYRRLLRESYHPDVLRDALDRDRLFDLLWIEIPKDEDLVGVIRFERDALWKGDIPCFSANPDSRHLRLGNGERLEDFFPEPSETAVRRIIGKLDEADCERQAWYIEASIGTLPAALEHWPSYRVVPSPEPADTDRLVAAAVALGNRLDQLAVRGANDASWVGLELERRRVWSIGRAALDLDAGVPGIALFLAYLGAVTGREAASSLARAALTTMRDVIADRETTLEAIGGFDGWGGVIYVLCHLGALWGQSDLFAQADALAARLPVLIDGDDDFDVFGGAAGCILSLRSLRRCRPSDQLTATAMRCGDRLLASAQREAGRLGWPRGSAGPSRRAGLLSGTAGIAYALRELHAWTGMERFRLAALEAQATALVEGSPGDSDAVLAARGEHARKLSCEEMGGIGFLEVCFAPAPRADSTARASVETAARAIRDRRFGSNHSLCYGDLGSLDVLARAALLLQDAGLTREVESIASTTLGDIERHGWRCGTPLGVETPGLSVGLAGIGLGLLRTARPDMVPSALVLEPPILVGRAHGR